MTRGKIVIVTTNTIYTSVEFNGDMYYSENSNGEAAYNGLNEVKSLNEYQTFLEKFNEERFEYPEQIYYAISRDENDSPFDMVHDYFDMWFSDYLYIKNLDEDDIIIRTKEYNITVKPNEIIVLNFGEDSEDIHELNRHHKFRISDALQDIIQQKGWCIYEGEDYVEFEKSSPLGEDFAFDVSIDNLIENIREYCENFDPDDHGAMWIQCAGRNGTPRDIRALANDAYDIQEMLEDLIRAIDLFMKIRY